MYIDRKNWTLPEIKINANMYQEIKNSETSTIIELNIILPEHIDESQKIRLYEIAKRCPISKILGNEIEVRY
jgi:putative redox protein